MDNVEVTIGYSPAQEKWISEVAINGDFAIDLVQEDDGQLFILYNSLGGEPHARRCSLVSFLEGVALAKQKLSEKNQTR